MFHGVVEGDGAVYQGDDGGDAGFVDIFVDVADTSSYAEDGDFMFFCEVCNADGDFSEDGLRVQLAFPCDDQVGVL